MNESLDTILLNVLYIESNHMVGYKEFNLLVYFVNAYFMKMPSLFFVAFIYLFRRLRKDVKLDENRRQQECSSGFPCSG